MGNRPRYTKIICTIGPASFTEEVITKMAARGMNIARLNFSHGDHAQHLRVIQLIREVNKKYGFKVKILQDLEGYRIRVGKFTRPKMLTRGKTWYISRESHNMPNHFPFDYEGDLKTIKRGDNIFIDDGSIHLRVLDHADECLRARVIQGGLLKERKGINIPTLPLKADIMTAQDQRDLEFGIQHEVDFVAQSFVRNREDIMRVRDQIGQRLPQCKLIAKIENGEGVNNLAAIVEVCDGVMVARGDLGVTLPIYKIPIIQKYIIRHCNRHKKLSMIATQMLDSMIDNGRPTRAEVSDVANAILDASDYVMLSGETAVGKFPSRSIKMMRQIIEYTEAHQELRI